MSCYWLEEPLLTGEVSDCEEGGIVIVGAGLSGVSVAYWLQEYGFTDLTLVDWQPAQAASFRNCGHILHGPVESMHALVELYGLEVAREIWQFSVWACDEVAATIKSLKLDVDYCQDGYYVVALEEAELAELESSVALLRRCGFASSMVSAADLKALGLRNILAARFDPGSAQGHPVKFRNALLAKALSRGCRYHSAHQVTSIEEQDGKVIVHSHDRPDRLFDAAVIATNAYSPLLSDFYAQRRLVEPFRGQILTSKPIAAAKSWLRCPHSFDHGYEYALVTKDHRLMIGGWRQNTEGKEVGTYELKASSEVRDGLKAFAAQHYVGGEDLQWQYEWTGIMAASSSGFPYIGPTDSDLIYTVAGYTGHGFSWAHGCAKALAQIMVGEAVEPVMRLFRPRQI